MQPLKVKVMRIHPDAILPQYQTPGSAAMDIHCHIQQKDVTRKWLRRNSDEQADDIIPPHEKLIVDTGLAFEIPPGFVMLVNSRSGQGFNLSVRLGNGQGWIDSDYRGELKVCLFNDSDAHVAINHGERIAQLMVVPVPTIELQEVGELAPTVRGENGLGSTGQ